MSAPTPEERPGRHRGQLLLAAIIAPPAGLIGVALLMVLAARFEDPQADPFRDRELTLFLLLLLGAGLAYLLEFLIISWTRTRRQGAGFTLRRTLVAFALTGLVFSPIAAGLLLPVDSPHHWVRIALLGTVGGLLSGWTFWLLAPERA
jgi:hypothetical protein